MMKEYRTEAVVGEGGTLAVKDLPFKAGERVEVVVHEAEAERTPKNAAERYPLRGKNPYQFDDPFSPVGTEEWESL